MKFNKLKKELNEIDYGSIGQQRKVGDMLGGMDGTANSMRITIMKKMGANPEEIAKWRSASKKGVTFEAYLIGLIQDIKERPYEDDGVDFNRAVMGDQRNDSSFKIE